MSRSSLLAKLRSLSVAGVIGALGVAAMIAVVMYPWLKNLHTFGFHDWDVETSHRYLAILSLLHYHELPGWNPYACGGFPAWGYVEADTILVSPFLPAYLILPLSIALRVEVLGMAALGAAGAWAAASRFTAGQGAAGARGGALGRQRALGAPDRGRAHLAPGVRVDAVVPLLLRAGAPGPAPGARAGISPAAASPSPCWCTRAASTRCRTRSCCSACTRSSSR